MRSYEDTHPWINFKVDFHKITPGLWIKLGKISSKCEHIAGVPIPPHKAKELYTLYLAKGALATTAIEGNTLTEEEAIKIIDGTLKLPPSRDYLAIEIENILKACNIITDKIFNDNLSDINIENIKEFNRIVFENLPLEDDVEPGVIRKKSVGVARYRAAPAADCEYLLDGLCRWLQNDFIPPSDDLQIIYTIIKAILAHLYIAWIHPFDDGNGRTARIIEFQILLSGGIPLPVTLLLSNHYNQTRQEYYRKLDETSKSGGNIMPFIEYAINGLLDGLNEQLETIRNIQWDIAWINFVHESFKDKNSEAWTRRRRLVLDLSQSTEPIPQSKVRQISPRVAEYYAGKARTVLTRDLNILKQLELIFVENNAIFVNRYRILAFLP